MSRAGFKQLSLLRASGQCLSTRSLATIAKWPNQNAIARSVPTSTTKLRVRPFSTTRPRRTQDEMDEESSSYSEADHEHAVISTFDLFSIGIGPSSSHTVGPMRAGNIFVNDLIEANLLSKVNKIRVAIYGSLALTGEGHMTPSALLLGLEGADVETVDTGYVPTRFNDIKTSKKIYLGRGLAADGSKGKEIDFDYDKEFIWEWGRKLPQHSNGMRFTVYDKDGYVLATNDMFSVGGGFVVNGALSIAPQQTLSPNAPAQVEDSDLESAAHPADLAENMYYKEIRRSDAAGDRRTGSEVKVLDEATAGPTALLGESAEPTDLSTDVKSETKSTSSSPHPRYPFRDAASLLSLCRKHNLTIAQLVYENEKSLGYTDEDIYRKIFKIWGVMDASILESVQMPPGTKLPGSLKLHRRAPALYRRLTRGLYPSSTADTSAAQLEHKFSSPDPNIGEDGAPSQPNALATPPGTPSASVPDKFMAGGLRKRGPPRIHGSLNHPIAPAPSRRTTFPTMDYLSVYAIAVNETNAGGGRIVTAPTNGAAGIIPAVLKYTTEFISDDPERDIPTFLLTAAAIGMLYKRGATISAAEGGCMAEVGVACSMAAGAFAACMGASPETIEQAAEIGIEHNLGLTCDPIGGLVQAPCIERNALGATKAISSANLALSSETGTQRVRLDDAIRAMRLTAKGMRNEFKETSLSGLATSVHINIPLSSKLFGQHRSHADHLLWQTPDAGNRYYDLIPSSSIPEIPEPPGNSNIPGDDNIGNIRLRLRLPIGQGNPEISFGNPSLQQRFLQFYTDEAHRKSWKNIRPAPDICGDHLSNQALSFINTCLRMCQENHQSCKGDDSSLPTRVLDIGSGDNTHAHLIETQNIENAKYTALSYCWGSDPSIKTLTGNLEEMKSGIALKELPAAYVDAIELTRQLGVKYIWIDALCIIQDSQSDWERECSRMADTYTNAHVTIAAASSSSVTNHFLKPQLRLPPQISRHKRETFTKAVLGSDSKGPVLVKVRLMQATGAHWQWQGSRSDQQPLMEPLTQRGWTLQEKVLSTRLLSISMTEMVWTCKEQTVCECGSRLNYQREFGGTLLSQISGRGEAFNFWHKIVENYSKRKLTQPLDKLPAISAIVAIVQKKIGSEYIAGLWAGNMELDLLWRRTESTRAQAASSCYIAPSFSWASITGEIDYLCFRNGKWPYEKFTKVIEVTSETGPGAPLGRVTSSKLVVQGPIAAGYVERQGSHGWFVVRLGNTRFSFCPDTTLSTTMADDEVSVCRRCHEYSKEEVGNLLQKSKSGSEGIKIRCWVLRLGAYRVGNGGEKEHQWLVLGKSNSQAGYFERVGWGSVRNYEEEQRVFSQETTATITLV
ncbi:putative l-serine dehydratase 2 [Fusarium longipes]|uniref:Putative l-serine dehydratase 2 n=1 Tax=Fusarium longipes TaxID=694270 RepID=A0A395RV48_9HYPO|nr:putative l-serine dehydratase 2 [Fusarium longipes]